MNDTQTTTLSPADVLGQLYGAVATGDLDTASSVLHPDVVLHVPGSHPAAGDHVGPDAVVAFIVRATTGTERVEEVEVLDVLGGAQHAAALCNAEGFQDGRHVMHNRTLHLFRVDEGLVRDIWFHNWDQSVVDDFWA